MLNINSTHSTDSWSHAAFDFHFKLDLRTFSLGNFFGIFSFQVIHVLKWYFYLQITSIFDLVNLHSKKAHQLLRSASIVSPTRPTYFCVVFWSNICKQWFEMYSFIISLKDDTNSVESDLQICQVPKAGNDFPKTFHNRMAKTDRFDSRYSSDVIYLPMCQRSFPFALILVGWKTVAVSLWYNPNISCRHWEWFNYCVVTVR